jgi:hypothetical protein
MFQELLLAFQINRHNSNKQGNCTEIMKKNKTIKTIHIFRVCFEIVVRLMGSMLFGRRSKCSKACVPSPLASQGQ